MSYYSTQRNKDDNVPAWAIGSVGLVIIVIFVLLITFLSGTINRVEPGNVGVLIDYYAGTTSGKPVITPVQPGQWKIVSPTQRLAKYDMSQQALVMVRREDEGKVNGDDSVDCKDKTGIKVNVDLTVLWKVNTEQIGELYLLYPGQKLDQISNEVVRRIARTTVADVCGQYTFLEIAGTKRVEFGGKVAQLLAPRLEDTFLIMTGTSPGEIYLEPAQQKAITDKSVAEQEALRAQYLLQQREYEASAAVAQAEGVKKVTILNAQAQAEAIRIINEQLGGSPYYIRYVYATRWNGILPTTLVVADGREFPLLGALDLKEAGISPEALADPAYPKPTATPSPTAKP